MAIKYKTTKEYQKFAVTMTVALLVVFAFIVLRHRDQWDGWASIFSLAPSLPYIFATSFTFLLTGIITPKSLAPIEWAWMKLAHYMGIVVTTVLVTLTFYLVITPTGFILKMMRKDLLKLKFDRQVDTYWIEVDKDGPASRPDKPY